MNKNILIAIVAGVILLIGGGFFFLNTSQAPETMSPTTNNTTAGSMEKNSLRGLLQLGNNQQCAFTDTESKSSGTVYIASGKARGDFQSDLNGTISGSHMISDGQDVYIWMDGGKEGFKTSLDAIEDLQSKMGTGTQEKTIDVDKQVDYSCSAWSVDNSMFTIPSDITFQDFSSMMEETNKMMEENNSMMNADDTSSACSACDNLPADAQAQCKTALKCN